MADKHSTVPTASAKELVEKALDRLNNSSLKVPATNVTIVAYASRESLAVSFDTDVSYKDSDGYWCSLKSVYMEFFIDAFYGDVLSIDNEAHINNIKDVNTRIELRLVYIVYQLIRAKIKDKVTQVKDKFGKYAQILSGRIRYLEDVHI